MRLLGRLLFGSLALVLAIPCGALVFVLGVLFDPISREAIAHLGLFGIVTALDDLAAGLPPETVVGTVVALSKALAILLLLPPVLVALIGETLQLKAFTWYCGATALLTAALPLIGHSRNRTPGTGQIIASEARILGILFVAGAISGLIYWLIVRAGWQSEVRAASNDVA